MLFHSWEFALFMPVVFLMYWLLHVRKPNWGNPLLLASSYFFYACWDVRFLGLILFSTLVDFFVGIGLGRTEQPRMRRLLLLSSLLVNLGLLAVFKYLDFFIEGLNVLLASVPLEINLRNLNIILPVGISFYTFQTLSYTIDVYKGKLKPTNDFIAFAAFVAFFPQLVAGPIERASHLLPQFAEHRRFNEEKARSGLRLILWGLFAKLVIADNAAVFADELFANQAFYPGYMLLLGAFLFSFQIYGDFAGYSNIAIGTARLLGFELMQNFATPYFSRDVAEFWRRWHISLSTWFRDYVYIPLGGSKGGKCLIFRNVLIVFILSGLWHGANWTFLVWGAIHAVLFLPLILSNKHRVHMAEISGPGIAYASMTILRIVSTFTVISLSWIWFRAETLSHAWAYLSGVFTNSWAVYPEIPRRGLLLGTCILILGFVAAEWCGRKSETPLDKTLGWPRFVRWILYVFLILLIGLFLQTSATPFLYFQF